MAAATHLVQDGSDMRIRLAEASDLADIVRCEERAFGMTARRGNIRDIEQRGVLAAQISDGHVHVMEIDTKIVGYISFSPIYDHIFVDTIAVLPTWHRNGLGSQLLDHAEQAASQLGFDSVKLFTDGNVVGNVRFYRRRGYHETDRCIDGSFSRIFYSKAMAALAAA